MTLPMQIMVPTALLALGGGVAACAAWAVFMPSSAVLAPVLRVVPDARSVALTFDDGPTMPFTEQILDILAEHQVRATFFVIGRNVQSAPHLARRMVEEGHTVGNHSWDHHHFGICAGRTYWCDQLQRTNQIIFETTGVRPVFFRPPMGFKTWHLTAAARALGMPLVGWSLRAFDTRAVSPEAVVRRITQRLGGGQIVLLHDGVEPARTRASQPVTVRALPAILREVRTRGLRPVALAQSTQPSALPLGAPA